MEPPRQGTSGEWLRRVRSQSLGRVRVRLSPEVLVGFPVEVFVNGHPGFVGRGMLGIGPELESDLVVWLQWWQERVGLDGDRDGGGGDDDEEDTDDWRRWNGDGRQLLARLKAELGEDYDVDWA